MSNKCKNKSFITKKKAFTLIELLIVIAIIGILFIVLISKVDFATDKAKTTGVQTDFRSFQLAFETVARENAGFSSLVDEDYEQLEMAINKNLDNKLKVDIDAMGNISMANGAKDPWNVEYHGQYVTGDDSKDRGAIAMYSNGSNMQFGSNLSITGGIASIAVINDVGKDDYSIVSCYSLANRYGAIISQTYGFDKTANSNVSNNDENLPGNPDDENNENLDEGLGEIDPNHCGIELGVPYTLTSPYKTSEVSMKTMTLVFYEQVFTMFLDGAHGCSAEDVYPIGTVEYYDSNVIKTKIHIETEDMDWYTFHVENGILYIDDLYIDDLAFVRDENSDVPTSLEIADKPFVNGATVLETSTAEHIDINAYKDFKGKIIWIHNNREPLTAVSCVSDNTKTIIPNEEVTSWNSPTGYYYQAKFDWLVDSFYDWTEMQTSIGLVVYEKGAGVYDKNGNRTIKWHDLETNYGWDITQDYNDTWGLFDWSNETCTLLVCECVERIGNYAFTHCSFDEVLFSYRSKVSIGNSAFYMANINYIKLPEVIQLGSEVFWNAWLDYVALADVESWLEVTYPDVYASPFMCSDPNVFVDSLKVPITKLDVRNGIRSISSNAFRGCNTIQEIVFHNGEDTLTINDFAFAECGGLQSVYINKNITLKNNVFLGSKVLVYCEDEEKPNDWGRLASDPIFIWGCQHNEIASDGSIYIVDDGVRYKLKDDQVVIAKQPSGITSLHIKSQIVYNGVTYWVTKFEDTYIGPEYTQLEEITVDEDHIYYSSIDGVLYNKAQTELICYPPARQNISFTIPEGIQTIKSHSFYNWHDGYLVNVYIPGSVRKIESDSFNFYSIRFIHIDDGLEEIDDRAFDYHINQIRLPNTLKIINTESIQSYYLYIPNSVTTIKDGGLGRVRECVLGTGIKTMSDRPFYDVSEVEYIISLSPTPIPLINNAELCDTIYVPDGSVSLYQSAPGWSKYTIYPLSSFNLGSNRAEVQSEYLEYYKNVFNGTVIGDYLYLPAISYLSEGMFSNYNEFLIYKNDKSNFDYRPLLLKILSMEGLDGSSYTTEELFEMTGMSQAYLDEMLSYVTERIALAEPMTIGGIKIMESYMAFSCSDNAMDRLYELNGKYVYSEKTLEYLFSDYVIYNNVIYSNCWSTATSGVCSSYDDVLELLFDETFDFDIAYEKILAIYEKLGMSEEAAPLLSFSSKEELAEYLKHLRFDDPIWLYEECVVAVPLTENATILETFNGKQVIVAK